MLLISYTYITLLLKRTGCHQPNTFIFTVVVFIMRSKYSRELINFIITEWELQDFIDFFSVIFSILQQ
jgi:hypothetical protein